jgi:hypothetical protein
VGQFAARRATISSHTRREQAEGQQGNSQNGHHGKNLPNHPTEFATLEREKQKQPHRISQQATSTVAFLVPPAASSLATFSKQAGFFLSLTPTTRRI